MEAPWWAASIAGIMTNQDPMENPKRQRTAVRPEALVMCGRVSDATPPARALKQHEASLVIHKENIRTVHIIFLSNEPFSERRNRDK